MKMQFRNVRLLSFVTIFGMLILNGCARYAHNVDALYEPSATIHNGSGEVYIGIPENQRTQSSDIKWVIGSVTDDENRKIDEAVSSRSPAEIIQAALGLELKKGGYTVIPTTKNHAGEKQVIELTKTEVVLGQISSLTDLNAKCRVLVGVDVFKKGQLIKRLQYESTSSNTDIKDRDVLAKTVLEDALQSVIVKAIPDLHELFSK
jgi:hypothetical protein